ncbi:MAG: hypothetical protein OES47_01110 [Acidobacteriota bacterium]|nr:hypothetical protein [Acidobacteriota bacterium]
MPSRIEPITTDQTTDEDLRQLLDDGANGWWKDTEMFGVIGRVPDLLKTIVPVFGAFFGGGRIEPHILEMMRVKTGQMNDCHY